MMQEPTEYEKLILAGLQRKPHIYQGTVPYQVVLARRAKNKAARQSRRVNRSRGR
jgi:hypothetical protein